MRYTLLCLLLLMMSCKQMMHEDHLPRATMQKILSDLHRAEVYSAMVGPDSLRRGGGKNMDSLSRYYKEIFAHYKVDTLQFRQSMNWYRAHPDELDSVYNNMIPQSERR